MGASCRDRSPVCIRPYLCRNAEIRRASCTAAAQLTVQAVLEMKAALDKEQITHQDDALRSASGQAFYNTSPFLLRDLKARATQQKLKDDFEAYLDGFSPNVQDILTNSPTHPHGIKVRLASGKVGRVKNIIH